MPALQQFKVNKELQIKRFHILKMKKTQNQISLQMGLK